MYERWEAWLNTIDKMETTRLIFRAWRDEDAEVLFRLASDPEVGPRAGWPPHRSAD